MSAEPTSAYGPHTEAWRSLAEEAKRLERTTIRELIERDPQRFARFSLERHGVLLDFSRQRLDARVLEQLLALAKQCQVQSWIVGMFAGLPINNTEDRAGVARGAAPARGCADQGLRRGRDAARRGRAREDA